MRARRTLALALLALAVWACRKPDPVAERLAQRRAYQVSLTGWNWKGGPQSGEAVLNLTVTRQTPAPLARLTVLVEAIGADGQAVLATHRESLDVAGLDYDVPRPMLVSLAGVDPRVEEGGFAVSVEPQPPQEAWADYPELRDLAP